MKPVIVFVLAAAACAAPMQTVQIVNRTSRTIEELYVYPAGSANHGASRAQLAPNASTSVSVRQGNVEVLAVSAKVKLDERNRDQPSASQVLEIVKPARVVFYDVGSKPAEVNQPGVFGIAFTLSMPNKPPPPTPQAGDEPPPPEE